MASSLSTLGLGSQGVLNYDIIEQLREVDNANQVAPIDRRLDDNSTKTQDLSILTTLTASLKGSTSTLSDDATYLKRDTSVSGSAASVNASSGTALQDFSLNVTQLAKQDIHQSNSFNSDTSTFTSTNDTININIDGKDYSFDVNSTTTLTDLKNMINDSTDGKVIASTLNVGGTNPYKLVLKSAQTGESQNMTITSTGGGTAVSDLGLDLVSNNIQSAQDAIVQYNGIDIQRSSNNINDLIVGVEITLNELGESNVSIVQDTTDISSGLADFTSKYNELMNNLNESTKYDVDTKASGSFQGVNEITSMKSSLNRMLISVDANGTSLSEFGLSLNDAGMLEFDENIFNSKMTENPDGVKNYFVGSYDVNTETTTSGIFTKFNNLLADLATNDNSVLGLYEGSLTNQKTSLETEKAKTIASLDAKYETMTQRFMAYDAMIGKLDMQAQSVQSMIDAANNNNSN